MVDPFLLSKAHMPQNPNQLLDLLLQREVEPTKPPTTSKLSDAEIEQWQKENAPLEFLRGPVENVMDFVGGATGLQNPFAEDAKPATGVGAMAGIAGPLTMGKVLRMLRGAPKTAPRIPKPASISRSSIGVDSPEFAPVGSEGSFGMSRGNPIIKHPEPSVPRRFGNERGEVNVETLIKLGLLGGGAAYGIPKVFEFAKSLREKADDVNPLNRVSDVLNKAPRR